MRQRTRAFLTLLGSSLLPGSAWAGMVLTPERFLAVAAPDPDSDPDPGSGELIRNGGFEFGTVGWDSRDVQIGAHPGDAGAHGGQGVAWFSGWQNGTPAVLRQTVRIPAGVASARLTYWLHIENHGDIPAARDRFAVKARPEGGPLAVLDVRSNLDGAPGYQRRSIDLGAYRGQTVELSFIAQDSPLGVNTAFTLDDVSLVAQ